MMTSRRAFLSRCSGSWLAFSAVAVGLCAGCDESVPSHSEGNVEKDKEVQDKMKEFMATKKAARKR